MPAAPILTTMNPADKGWRQQASKPIRSVCSSRACHELLRPWVCDPNDTGSLMIAEALRLVFGQGEVYCVTGFPMSPPGSPPRFLNAVLFLAGYTFADASGVITDRQIRARWLKHNPMIITSAIAPVPPQADWAMQLPGVAYDQATVAQIAALFN